MSVASATLATTPTMRSVVPNPPLTVSPTGLRFGKYFFASASLMTIGTSVAVLSNGRSDGAKTRP